MPVAQHMSKTTQGFPAGAKRDGKYENAKRAISGHPSPSYMQPQQSITPGQMYAMPGKGLSGAANAPSGFGLHKSNERRVANALQRQRAPDSQQGKRNGSLHIPAINRGLLPPALNY